MKVHSNSIKFLLLPIYYLIHYNLILGLIHKFFIKNFYYKKFKFELNIKNLPISTRASFLFNTYEYNDRILIEKYIDRKNSCILIGGGIGFIATLAYHNSKKKIYVFEINKNLIKNLKKNLQKNNCSFQIFEKNLIFNNKDKYSNFFISENFLLTSKYLQSKDLKKVENINFEKIKSIKNCNTLIIDGEGIEEFFINNLEKMPNIKYLIFELHYNILSKKKISKLFNQLKSNEFILISKNFNSFYFKKK